MFESYSADPVFNVKAMTHQTGVAAATLRAWERRYGVPSPPRTDSGYRLYSARDVAIIRWLKAQIEAGMNISQAVGLLQTQINAPEAARASSSAYDLPASLQRLHDEVIAATLEFDEDKVERALSEAFALFSVEDVCVNLIQPLMVTVGEKWHTGNLSVSHEHFVTNLVRRRLLALLAATPPPHHAQRIVTACAPDEYHELGLVMISIFLRREGYGVVYLGQSTPANRIEEVLETVKPEALLISASHLRAASNLLALYESLQEHPAAGRPVVLAYGGRIFGQAPALRARIPGLYLGGSAVDAAHSLSRMLKRRDIGALHPTTARAAARDAVDELRLHKPDIISLAARGINHDTLDLNHIRPKSERAIETAERLFQVLDSSLFFDEPGVLAEAAYWEWDSLTPDGMLPEQMQMCAQHFCSAVRSLINPLSLPSIEPFLAEMADALNH
jgi:DNA-binding transcriptional MerR regulator